MKSQVVKIQRSVSDPDDKALLIYGNDHYRIRQQIEEKIFSEMVKTRSFKTFYMAYFDHKRNRWIIGKPCSGEYNW